DLFLWEHATDNYYPLAEAEVLLEVNYPEVEDNWSLVWGDLRPDISFNPTASNYIVGNQLELDLDFFAGNLIEEYSLYLETENQQFLLGTYNEINENISLEISEEMVCNRGEISCEFAFNGDQYRVLANYKINILPADFTINYPVGWSLTTYYDTTATDPSAAFSGLEEIIGWSSGYYIPSEIYFADSFWLHLEQTENYLFSQATGISVQSVEPGWNLYSNQAWINIAKENLTFNISGNIYNYQELYEMGICPYEIIGYRDGKYLSIDSINVGEAFWFYFYPTVELDNFYLADLFPDNPELPDQIAEITSLTAKYTDAEFPIKVGLNAESSDELDLYDSPTPPTPPFNQKQIYLTSDQPEIYQGKLATDFREFAETNTSYSWDFFIRHQDSEYATIEIEINENPEYNYYLRWGLDQFELANGSSLDLICFADEISSGQFIIVKALSGEEELSLDSDLSCYPNPFLPNNSRQGFQLQFSLQEPAKVELEIYNIKGQLVKTLINDKLEKGNHKSVWDGKDAAGKHTASGVYLIKLAKGKEITARKMLLLK
ncbi:MAG: FlgD immunoglobulin-like domain containing protein, partial [Candidatus Cloacimonadales bacterium]